MRFYTNVVQHRGQIYMIGYNGNTRVQSKVKFKPYLFVTSSKASSPYRTLDGKIVERVDFDSMWDAKQFVKKYEDVAGFSYYGMTNFLYLYLYEEYPGEIKFKPELIRVMNIDIETKADDGFPDPSKADQPITAITIRQKKRTVSFAYAADYTPKEAGQQYVYCIDEEDMLKKFMRLWINEDWTPDVVTGWNVEFFDMPYLVNRITKILGEEIAKKLSPWGILEEKTVTIHDRPNQVFVPLGVTVLDYMQLYKKFSFKNQESYKLDYIAEIELGIGKLVYDGTLTELYENDFEKFMDYNIRDVMLVEWLDDKLKLIDQVFTLAYDAKVNYADTMATVRPWDVIIHNYLLDKNIVIPQFKASKIAPVFAGGYVKEPITGMHKWVVSYDLASLYPHLIMQFNISPETIRKRLSANLSTDELLAGDLDDYRDDFVNENLVVAGNMQCYTKEKRGFLPELMESMFNDRSKYKKLMLEAETEYQQTGSNESKNAIARYNNMQMARKIQLNSAYGALGNKYFRWFDVRNAEAVTLSGQLAIRWIEKEINALMNQTMGTNGIDYVIASDTDSVYINMDAFVKKMFPMVYHRNDNKEICALIDTACKKVIKPHIDKAYESLRVYCNATDQKMVMKREVIANKGIWKAKKMYILNVLNSEGVDYAEPKLKVMGIEAVRSSTPQVCRGAIKDALKLIMNGDEAAVQQFIADFKAKFMAMSFEQTASPRGCNGMDVYADRSNIYKKGTPLHVKGALLYNKLVTDKNLTNKYPLIYNGDKIKFSYLITPNHLKDTVIASPGELPAEFDIDRYIDREKQFSKSFSEPINTILTIIGWSIEKRSTLERFMS